MADFTGWLAKHRYCRHIIILALAFSVIFALSLMPAEYLAQTGRISALISLFILFSLSALKLLRPFSSSLMQKTGMLHKHYMRLAALLAFFLLLHLAAIYFNKPAWGPSVFSIKNMLLISNASLPAVSLGFLGLYLCAAALISGAHYKKIVKTLGRPAWEAVHKAGYFLYILAYLHAAWIGYDFESKGIFIFFSFLLAANILLIIAYFAHYLKYIPAGSALKKSRYVFAAALSIMIPLILTLAVISGSEDSLKNSIISKAEKIMPLKAGSHGLAEGAGNEPVLNAQDESLQNVTIDKVKAIHTGYMLLSQCMLSSPYQREEHPYYMFMLKCENKTAGILYNNNPKLDTRDIKIGGIELKYTGSGIPYYILFLTENTENSPLAGEMRILAATGEIIVPEESGLQ